MGELILDLQQQNNWQQTWNDHVYAQPVDGNPNRRIPIRSITCPILLENHVIAIFIDSDTAAPHWKFAGMLHQIIPTGLSAGGLTNAFAYRQKVYLYRNNFIVLPKYTSQYAIRIDVPYWIVDLKLFVFEYIALVGNTTDIQLNTLEEGLNRIEGKLENTTE